MVPTNFGSSSSIWFATAIQILPWVSPKLRIDFQNSIAFLAMINLNTQYNFRTSKFDIIANRQAI